MVKDKAGMVPKKLPIGIYKELVGLHKKIILIKSKNTNHAHFSSIYPLKKLF